MKTKKKKLGRPKGSKNKAKAAKVKKRLTKFGDRFANRVFNVDTELFLESAQASLLLAESTNGNKNTELTAEHIASALKAVKRATANVLFMDLMANDQPTNE